jgi:hypothetical protein
LPGSSTGLCRHTGSKSGGRDYYDYFHRGL